MVTLPGWEAQPGLRKDDYTTVLAMAEASHRPHKGWFQWTYPGRESIITGFGKEEYDQNSRFDKSIQDRKKRRNRACRSRWSLARSGKWRGFWLSGTQRCWQNHYSAQSDRFDPSQFWQRTSGWLRTGRGWYQYSPQCGHSDRIARHVRTINSRKKPDHFCQSLWCARYRKIGQ